MSKLTVTIPDDLHQKIREELERQGITTSQFIEQAVTTFFEKPKGVSNMATRTLAFQVSEELLQRIKTFLARYEQIYHRKLSQKEFLVHLIERELDEAEKDYERITTEQAAEENADVDSGEPDGTEMEVDLNTIYPKENSKWNPRTIHAILRNEKYIGDSLYQKTYTTDSLPLKRYLNTGQRSKYYAMETHEGIISKTDYEKVQNLLAKKSITGEIDRTCVFSKKIYCSICGAICSRKGPPTQGFVWCCRTHLQSKALCLLKSIREDELQQAFLSIYNRLQCNQKTILEPLVDDLLGLRHLQEQKYKKRLALGEDIQHLAKQKHNLTRIHTLGYIEEPQFIERSAAIEQQIRERKQQLSRNDMSNTSEKILQKTRLIQKKLSSTPPLELFDESVFKELVKKVLISNTAIQFELINGMKLSESRAAT